MKMDGRRESGNVEDRRGQRSSLGGLGGGGMNILNMLLQLFMAKKANAGGGKSGCGKFGLLALLVVGVILFFALSQGGGCSDTLNQLQNSTGINLPGLTQNPAANGQAPKENDELATFAKQIFASTEDVWTKIFKEQGWGEYKKPTLVLFSGAVSSGCGNATSDTGPFYCSADQKVYIDLDFFRTMKSTIGEGGDFAYAYVIAHEVGHHVQYLLGQLQEGHKQMSQYGRDTPKSNQVSVRLELQADFYAGVWANYEGKMFKSIEDGDIEEALHAASLIGDDYLQKKARGIAYPETFNHGKSEQRNKWLKKGITTGDVSLGNTFNIRYEDL